MQFRMAKMRHNTTEISPAMTTERRRELAQSWTVLTKNSGYQFLGGPTNSLNQNIYGFQIEEIIKKNQKT
jgi:hypothetical protein